MAVNSVDKYLILLFLFTCFCFVSCRIDLDDDDDEEPDNCRPVSVSTTLNLTEGSVCWTDGHNGTCVSLYKCTTAALTYKYRNAGFSYEDFPEFPDICSIRDGRDLIVCCTDCKLDTEETIKNLVLLPDYELGQKSGLRGRDRCLDYLQYLPYGCTESATIKIEKTWNDTLQCSELGKIRLLAEGGRDAERWEFPHMVNALTVSHYDYVRQRVVFYVRQETYGQRRL